MKKKKIMLTLKNYKYFTFHFLSTGAKNTEHFRVHQHFSTKTKSNLTILSTNVHLNKIFLSLV